MIRELHLTLLDKLLRDANIQSIVPLEGSDKCGIFYDEIHRRYVLTGFNIQYSKEDLAK